MSNKHERENRERAEEQQNQGAEFEHTAEQQNAEQQNVEQQSAEQQSAEQSANGEAGSSAEDARNAATEAEEEETPELKIASLQEQLESQRDRYMRLMAEFDNYKRRTSREYERLIAGANERLMLEIIDVRENFQRALDAGLQNKEYDKFYEGMKLIFTKFDDVLGKNGLSVFAEPGEEFNPEVHDAMMKAPSEEFPEDHIAQIYEKGYKLNDRVIKHAKVIVSSGTCGDSGKAESDEG